MGSWRNSLHELARADTISVPARRVKHCTGVMASVLRVSESCAHNPALC
jgi:hypothetical protein